MNIDLIGKVFTTKQNKIERVIKSYVKVMNSYAMVNTDGSGETIYRAENYINAHFVEVVEKLPTDTGTDLIGITVLHVDSKVHYDIISKHTKNKRPSIKIRWGDGKEILFVVENVRLFLADGSWKIVGPTKDVGEDLIGRKITRGGTCVYTFDSYNVKTKRMKLKWKNGTDSSLTLQQCRVYLATSWKFIEENIGFEVTTEVAIKVSLPAELVVSPNKTARIAYEIFKSRGWEHIDFVNRLKDEYVKKYLEEVAESPWKAPRIRQIMQNISEKENEKEPQTNSDKWLPCSDKTDPYTTLEKEETIMQATTVQKTVAISICVPTSAFATVPSFDVIYGRPVADMTESDLFNSLRHISEERSVLMDLKSEGVSKRITAKIKKLDTARACVLKAIDELEDEV